MAAPTEVSVALERWGERLKKAHLPLISTLGDASRPPERGLVEGES
jgi:hypothetical protein